MIDQEGNAFLADFGIARLLERHQNDVERHQSDEPQSPEPEPGPDLAPGAPRTATEHGAAPGSRRTSA